MGTNSWSPADYTPWLRRGNSQTNELPPCTWGTPLISYLNQADVKAALHIPKEVQPWNLCTDQIHYAIQPKGSQWIYEALKGRYQMLHYSGDVDGAVPTIGTQNWIADMNWDVKDKWSMYKVNDNVAGYTESYTGGLTLPSMALATWPPSSSVRRPITSYLTGFSAETSDFALSSSILYA